MKLLIFGPQASGKGTQAKKIAVKYNMIHISTGDIFRENIKRETTLGKKAKAIIDAGNLMPDEITVDLVRQRLAEEDCVSKGYILDGFPRNIEQAKALSTFADIDCALLVDVSDEDVMKRITGRYMSKTSDIIYNVYTEPKPKKVEYDAHGKCVAAYDDETNEPLFQRDDDKDEKAVKQRLATYHKLTKPVLDYYEEKKLLKKIDGRGGIYDVFEEIVKILNEL